MCEAGRIRHHLKHNLWRPECLILFTGYQAEGTLGRIILDKAKPSVRLFDEDIVIKAEIAALHNTSSHADKTGLTDWINAISPRPRLIFINHGSPEACDDFTEYLKHDFGYNAVSPYSGTVYDLVTGNVLVQTEGILKQTAVAPQYVRDPRAVRVFNRLMDAVNRLASIAKRSEWMSNKDIAKFADQIDQISDKWSK